MPANGAKGRIRAFLIENVGKVVTTKQISEVANILDYPRRIRELRNEEGMRIRSYRDRDDLRPKEYLLESLTPEPVIARSIGAKLRMEILERNGYTCQLCGRTGGDTDPTDPSRKVRLVIDHVIPSANLGANDPNNLRVLCTACNHARSNLETPTESTRSLLARIRRAPRDVQREVFEALKRTFDRE